MSEKELQELVVGLARWAGYKVFHVIDSRKSTGPGFPDLVMVNTKTGRLVFAELKTDKGKFRPGQQEWLDALGMQHTAVVWRPADWHSGEISRVLRGDTGVVAL
jgi:hypothetical protein